MDIPPPKIMSLVTRILEDEEFIKSMVHAHKEQEITGLETGFTVGLGSENQYKVSDVQISHDNLFMIQDHNYFYNADNLFDWMYIHFHGDYSRYSYPSPSDLTTLYFIRKDLYEIEGIITKPIMGIASYKEKEGRTNLLLIQETKDQLFIEDKIINFAEAYEIMSHSSLTHEELKSYIMNSGMFLCVDIELSRKMHLHSIHENYKYFRNTFSLREDYDDMEINHLDMDL